MLSAFPSSFVALSIKHAASSPLINVHSMSSFHLHGLPPSMSSSDVDSSNMISGQTIPFTLLSALAIGISYADRSNLSTAIIPMAAAFHWDSLFSGVVLSAFWGGYALTQVLGGRLAGNFSIIV